MEEVFPSGTKWGFVSTSTPQPCNTPLPAERILNALPRYITIARFCQNLVTSWAPFSLQQSVAAYRPQDDNSGLTIHSHRFDCNWLKLMCLCKSSVFTAFVLLCAICSCASFHCWPIQVYSSKSINTHAIPNQTPIPALWEDRYTIRAWPISYIKSRSKNVQIL